MAEFRERFSIRDQERLIEAWRQRRAAGRARTARERWRRILRRPRFCLLPVAAFFGYALLLRGLAAGVPHAEPVVEAIGWTAYIVPVLVLTTLTRGRFRRFVRRQLNRRGDPTCVACGYDLSGHDGSRGACSECGRAFGPSVRRAFRVRERAQAPESRAGLAGVGERPPVLIR